jgi:hypothetical protein
LNYLAWCRAARVDNGIPPGGTHSSFFVPAAINANIYYTELLNRIATAAAGGNIAVAYNGVLIAPGGGILAGGLPLVHGNVVQIFVNITGAANIGGAVIQGIKCNLGAAPLPAAVLATVGGLLQWQHPHVQHAIEAGSSIREALYTSAHVGAHAVVGAFVTLYDGGGGGGALATAAAPQSINVVEIRISPVGGATSISLYPI